MSSYLGICFAEDAGEINLRMPGTGFKLYNSNGDFGSYGYGLKPMLPPGWGVLKAPQELTGSPDCNQEDILGSGLKLTNFALSAENIAGLGACGEIKSDYENRYTEENCKLTVACSKTITKRNTPNMLTIFTIPKYMAEDFVGLKFQQSSQKMEKLDLLRKYAEKKFGKKAVGTCSPRFEITPNDSKSCEPFIMDKGFERLQNRCSSMLNYCYNGKPDPQKDYKNFTKTFKATTNNDSSIISFFNGRTDSAVNDSLTNDDELINNLNLIMESKESSAQKMEKTLLFLNDYKKLGKFDPVFSYSEDSVESSMDKFKKSPHFKFFEKLSQAKTNSATIRSSLEQYRMETAKSILDKNCSSTPTYGEICKEANEVYKSKKVNVWNRSFASGQIETDSEDERFEAVKLLYPNGVKTKEDFTIVMEAHRCRAFGFTAPRSKDPLQVLASDQESYMEESYFNSSLGWGDELSMDRVVDNYLSRTPSFDFSYKPTEDAKASSTEVIKPISNEGLQANSAIAPITTDEISKAGISGSAEKIQNNFSENGSLSANLADNFKDSANISGLGNSSSFNTANFNNLNRPIDKDAIVKADSVDVKKSESSGLTDKISELTKRLSASEENLEIIKAEKAAALEKQVADKKIADENKTIADLKEQINSLKASAKTEVAVQPVQKAVVENYTAPLAQSNSIKSSYSEAEKAPAKAQAKNSARENSQSQQSASGSESSQSSSSFRAASSSGNGGSATSSVDTRPSLILSKSDGQSNEKIYEKIFELKGEHFFIEEGGVVKEIKPLVVNNQVVTDKSGKPIFETIILGKKGSKRLPASVEAVAIKSNADLKRDQEEKMKYDKAQYLKLKKLTNEAWNKK